MLESTLLIARDEPSQTYRKPVLLQGRQRKVPRAANPGVLKEKARRLALVDMLLWDFNPVTESSRESKCSGRTHAWLASVVHAIVSICMRAVSCHLTDIKLMLFQDTVPGPWQSAAPSAGNCGMTPFLVCKSGAQVRETELRNVTVCYSVL